MSERQQILSEHETLTRRVFLRAGAACVAATGGVSLVAGAAPPAPELAKALDKLEPYFTPQEDFQDVSRGKPVPHSLPEEKKREVGLCAIHGNSRSSPTPPTRQLLVSH